MQIRRTVQCGVFAFLFINKCDQKPNASFYRWVLQDEKQHLHFYKCLTWNRVPHTYFYTCGARFHAPHV